MEGGNLQGKSSHHFSNSVGHVKNCLVKNGWEENAMQKGGLEDDWSLHNKRGNGSDGARIGDEQSACCRGEFLLLGLLLCALQLVHLALVRLEPELVLGDDAAGALWVSIMAASTAISGVLHHVAKLNNA
ncbi:hypothetical protein C8J57DRAFT_1211388 [Mycena rebaudengoi]|nr:hypothetical protein C8J57DRAFT_1211388 [Mycena rebaudengoi]